MKRFLILFFCLSVVMLTNAQNKNLSLISEVYRIVNQKEEKTHEIYHHIVYNIEQGIIYLNDKSHHNIETYKLLGDRQEEIDDEWRYVSAQCEDNNGNKCAMVMRLGINENQHIIISFYYKDIRYDYLITNTD